MDEVLADTLGAIIEAVNIETKLGITMESLHWSEIKPRIPEHDGLVRDILKRQSFRHLKVIPHAQEVVENLMSIMIYIGSNGCTTSFHDKYEWLLEYFPFYHHSIFFVEEKILRIDDNLSFKF